MSKIIFNNENLSLITPSVGEYILAVDTDGVLKLKSSTDTIVLGATGSVFLQSYNVTYSEFSNLVATSGLQEGGVYIITDFKTRHYIQYTDTVGDGTGGSETINTGSSEQICVLATSNSSYDRRVRSLSFPDDEIIWEHSVSDRQYDHAGGVLSTGHVIYRRSPNGNERDYDFRRVIFRRWNDGSGNYTVVRRIDAPNPLDFIDVNALDDNSHFNNKVRSSFTQSGTDYYMDNFVFATPSYVGYNTFEKAYGGNVTGTFSNNKLGDINYTNFNEMTNTEVKFSNNSNFIGSVDNSTFGKVISSTLSNITDSKFNILESSVLGTSSNDTVGTIWLSSINSMMNNTIDSVTQSSITDLISNKVIEISDQVANEISYNSGNIVSNNTSDTISKNTFYNISANTASYIVSNDSDSIFSNITATISNNIARLIATNSVDEISYNISDQIIENQLAGSVLKNKVISIENNVGTVSIVDNIGQIIGSNSVLGSIESNKVTYIVDNQHNASFSTSNIRFNEGRMIATNSVGDVEMNRTDEISLNTSGDFINNNSKPISQNALTLCENNHVVNITLNIATTSNITDNRSQTITNNQNSVIKNVVDNISSNQGVVSNNIGYTVSFNTSVLIDANKVNRIENNSVTYTEKNIGNNILLNLTFGTSSMRLNGVKRIESNTNIGTMSNNWGNLISSNQVRDIQNNDVSEILSNSNSKILNNKGELIQSNTDALSNGGIIQENSVARITQNVNFSNISYNTGNLISQNQWVKDLYRGATTTFEFLAGTPSVGDVANITINGFSFSVTSTTASAAGFLNQIYSVFPVSGFTATYSTGLSLTLESPQSVISYQGATFSIDLVGTYSRVDNTSFSGSGLNDLTLDASSFSSTQSVHYLLVIESTGAFNDKFLWFDDKGNSATGVTISGGSYSTLSYGMKVSFANSTAHVVADNWDFDVVPNQSPLSATYTPTFGGEEYLNISKITYNTVNKISNNLYKKITNTVANVIQSGSSSFSVKNITDQTELFSVSEQGIKIGTYSNTSGTPIAIDINGFITTYDTSNYNILTVNVMTYSATVSNYGKDYFGVGYTASPVTINLPSITGIQDGKLVTIKDETGSSSINPITINTNGSETLDGSTQSQLAIDYGSLSFVKKSNGWWFI